MPNIEQVTVAAFDESIGGGDRIGHVYRPYRILYTVIICLPPSTLSRGKLPAPEQALETPRDYGLLIGHHTAYPYQMRKKFAEAWINSLEVLMRHAQEELRMMQCPPIGLLYIDGPKPPELYPLMGETFTGKGELVGIRVVSAPKTRNHNYMPELDPLGKGLLTLADGIAGILREKGNML